MISTGNIIVDEVGKMNFSGNIIPEAWYKTILKSKTGKPNLRAIIFLSDIVYWYRPTEVRDEMTGEIIGFRKKMHGDLLQRSYQDWAEKYGCSKGEATTTIDELVEIGVIEKEFRTIQYKGVKVSNVLFIKLNVDKLKELTYGSLRDEVEENTPITKKIDRVVEKESAPTHKKAETNTKNKTNTTSKNTHSFSPQKAERMKTDIEQVVKEIHDNKGIPYKYTESIELMTSAIHYLTEWEQYCEDGYAIKAQQQFYLLAVDALIEMTTEVEIKTYNHHMMSRIDIINKINQTMRFDKSYNIREIIDWAWEDYKLASSEKEIRYPKKYIKSILVENMDLHEIKLESLINRTYQS